MQTNKPLKNKLPVRRITVCRKSIYRLSEQRYAPFPILSLTGKWLLDSGFKIGHMVDIACETGKLIITLSNEQPHIKK